MNKTLILIVIIVLVVGIFYTYESTIKDTFRYLMDDVIYTVRILTDETVYFVKANDWYVSKRYSIDVENSTTSGKDYAFWGRNKQTDELLYIMYVYKKGVYLVDGNEGITIDEANIIATKNDMEPLNISLVVISLFSEDKSIVDYMYWVIDYGDGNSQYIKFSDGMVEEDPFNINKY